MLSGVFRACCFKQDLSRRHGLCVLISSARGSPSETWPAEARHISETDSMLGQCYRLQPHPSVTLRD